MRNVYQDPRFAVAKRAAEDPRMMRSVLFMDKESEDYQRAYNDGLTEGRGYTMADGLYYSDTRQPFMIAEQSQITGTGEALLWPAQFTSLVANYFTVGKMVYYCAWGKTTTAGSTPGNLTATMRYGTTTGGTSIAASAATALTTSKSNINFITEGWVCCQATGSGTNGKLVANGRFMTDGAGNIFSTAGNMPLLFPATSPGTSTGVDTTSAQGIILDFTLGAAGDLMTVGYLQFMALN
jgi:hypothetical protein